MKKILILFTVLSLVFSLTACGDNEPECTGDQILNKSGECVDPEPDPDPITCDPGYVKDGDQCVPEQVDDTVPTISGAQDVTLEFNATFDVLAGITADDAEDGDLTNSITYTGEVNTGASGVYTIVYSVTDSDNNTVTVTILVTVNSLDGCPVHHELVGDACVKIPAEEITIMHGAVYEIDPFHDDFSGTEQLARQELQRAVEEQYNVIINYENYPSSAGWGPSRISAIIQASVAGEPMSDVYWVTSDWIQELVQGNALADTSSYIQTLGTNVPEAYYDIGEYQDGIYGFESYTPGIDGGLYYNADLIESLGVANPTDLYLAGQWNWTTFEQWATQVQTALDGQPEDMYALGGMFSYYAEAMTTLNGGSLINKQTGRVSFAQNPALETYDFLTTLWDKGLFEPAGQYDAGSPEWLTGKVAMHPGSLWFLTASNRWGGIPFEIGFVPYPVADDFTGEYSSPISGVAVMSIASGMDPEREQLVFTVWNALQLSKTEEEAEAAFRLTLMTKFDEENYIDAYLAVYDKVYLDILNAIGISAYGENGWARNINGAIKDGTSRTAVDTIKPIYQAALEDYLDE